MATKGKTETLFTEEDVTRLQRELAEKRRNGENPDDTLVRKAQSAVDKRKNKQGN
ncbi:MAG: hypothetical protein HYZ43_03910 [Flavobacteriia bacterium]|nr:hypothetical protein [Flavobacteriia bacterium]